MIPILILLSLPAQSTAQSIPSLEEALVRLQANVEQFEASLPDFICNERVTSRELVHGVVVKEAINESEFIGLQQKRGRHSFTEIRKVLSVNGKPVRDRGSLRGPFLFGGGFSSLLDMTFSPKHVPLHNYWSLRAEQAGDRTVLVLEFATKEGQEELRIDFEGKVFVQRDTGKAWIDLESMQVSRIERSFLNVPARHSPIVSSVEFARVPIGDKQFWMPKTVKSEQTRGAPNHEKQEQYLAEYSNYKKFEASADIKFTGLEK